MERLIKYYRTPSFSAAQLTTRNPFLKIGEVVFEIGPPKRCKVGPGFWNDLDYFQSTIYDVADLVTNPIGDAEGDLSGKTFEEIFELMLNPYLAPAITGLQNNAGGGYGNVKIVEVGQSLSGSVLFIFNTSSPENLLGATPINVDSGGIFSNDGSFPYSGGLNMSIAGVLNPSVPTTYDIEVTATHQQGVTDPVLTQIKFFPKIIWGVSALATLTPPDVVGLSQKQTLITDVYKRDYSFTASGYCWLAIPEMLAPTSLLFADVTNPHAPAGFSVEDMGTLTVNNGVGTYLYRMLRSTYSIVQPLSVLRVG